MTRIHASSSLAFGFLLLAVALSAGVVMRQARLPSEAVTVAFDPAVQGGQVDYGGLYQFLDPQGSMPVPYQDGSHQVIPWHTLEPRSGVYNWSALDSYVADRAGWGLHIALGFNTVDYDAAYCADQGASQCWSADDPRGDRILLPVDMLDPEDENSTYVVCPLDSSYAQHRLPKYWSGAYKTAYQRFVNALASHITASTALSSAIDWIEIPVGVYGEYNPGRTEDRPCLQDLGLTQALWEETTSWMIDTWVVAFAGTGIDLSFQGTPYYVDKGDRQRMNDYAAASGLGLQHAKWHPDEEDMSIQCTDCWSRGKGVIDHVLRWENQVPFAIEQPDHPLLGDAYRTMLNEAEEDYWNMASFLDLKGDVYKARLSPRGELKRLTAENPYVLSMVQTLRDLAGRDETDAPYAMVWMRETEADSFPWWPKCNNFDFYLRASTAQEPSNTVSCPGVVNLAADGQAIAVTDLDEIYVPGSCPNDAVYSATCDPRYRYARQTQPGQPFIYLDVATAYRFATGVDAIVEIDYLDVGLDQIGFQWYDGAGQQTEILTKTNTMQWQTWLLDVTGMDLTDRFVSGSTAWDFRVADNGDGLETIHSVKFQPLNMGTPVATPTPTPSVSGTPSPAATLTLTSTVTTTPSSVWTPTLTATATATPAATPWLLHIDYTNSAWQDVQIWAEYPTIVNLSSPSINPRANSTDGAAVLPEYPTTKRSVLYSVPFNLPPGATVNKATLYLAPMGYAGDPVTLKLRAVTVPWRVPSWNLRRGASPASPWEAPGATGPSEVGPVLREYRFGSAVASQDVVALDVTGAVQSTGGLALKIEPWCTPDPSSGVCQSSIQFGAAESRNVGKRPYLEVDLISQSAPTPTPTPTQMPTPVRAGVPEAAMATATAEAVPAATPNPLSLRQGLVINEVCTNSNQTENLFGPMGSGDSAVELFNSAAEPVDLADYRLCVNNTCLWLEGTLQPLGYRVYFGKQHGLSFNKGLYNDIRLEQMQQAPTGVVSRLIVENQTPDRCWAAESDASTIFVEKWPPTLGQGNSSLEYPR